jgi:hypothetical protein
MGSIVLKNQKRRMLFLVVGLDEILAKEVAQALRNVCGCPCKEGKLDYAYWAVLHRESGDDDEKKVVCALRRRK